MGKFDALHIGHRELAIQAAKVGPPFLLSFVGIAEVLGWEPRYGCYISLLFIYLNSSFPNIYGLVINCLCSVLNCLLGSHCRGTQNWFCIMTEVKMVEGCIIFLLLWLIYKARMRERERLCKITSIFCGFVHLLVIFDYYGLIS